MINSFLHSLADHGDESIHIFRRLSTGRLDTDGA